MPFSLFISYSSILFMGAFYVLIQTFTMRSEVRRIYVFIWEKTGSTKYHHGFGGRRISTESGSEYFSNLSFKTT